MPNADVFCPATGEGKAKPKQDRIADAVAKDQMWLDHVHKMMESEEVGEDDVPIMRSGYTSRHTDNSTIKPPAEIGILPLFEEKAASAGMIKHCMDVCKKGTEFLNPGQTPVTGFDQPLHALAKQLQWQFPAEIG